MHKKGKPVVVRFPFPFFLLLAGGRAEAALALTVRIIVYRDAVGQENALCERITRLNRQQLALDGRRSSS